MTNKDQEYLEHIEEAIYGISRLDETDEDAIFEKCLFVLEAVVPKYGLSLEQLNIILDIIINDQYSFKKVWKTKLLRLLDCREMLDFDTVIKILSTFKVESNISRKQGINNVPRTTQIKLATFMLKNFPNTHLDPRFLKMLNWIFNLLTIGYLRQKMGLFLCYLLQLATEIDEKYNHRLFFTQKKYQIVLDLYSSDPKSMQPVLLCFFHFLNSSKKNIMFDSTFMTYTMVIEKAKIKKDFFGKMDTDFVQNLTEKKTLLLVNDMETYSENLKIFGSLLQTLNDYGQNIMRINHRKRPHLNDPNESGSFQISTIYSPQRLVEYFRIKSSGSLELITFLASICSSIPTPESSQVAESSSGKRNFELQFYYKILACIIDIDMSEALDIVKEYLAKNNSSMTISMNESPIEGLGYLLKFDRSLKITEKTLDMMLIGDKNDTSYTNPFQAQLLQIIRYLDPEVGTHFQLLKGLVLQAYKQNDVHIMQQLVLLAWKWTSHPKQYNALVKLILKEYSVDKDLLLGEILALSLSMQKLTANHIDLSILVLKPDIVADVMLSENIIFIEVLLRHLQHCENVFEDGAYNHKKDEGFRKAKLHHQQSVQNVLRYLQIGSEVNGALFSLPVDFIEKLGNPDVPSSKLLNILEVNHIMATSDQADVLSVLRSSGFSGIHQFMEHHTKHG